jgi:hypothetical protein
MPRKTRMLVYDNFDFHVSDAVENGQPEDNAFTHIGFFIAWLIRHDLVNQNLIGETIPQQVRSGALRPNELRDVVDGALVAEFLAPEGIAFADAYYDRYAREYAAEFSDLPAYGVPDEPEYEARITPIIDRAYATWVGDGRPKPRARSGPKLPEGTDPSRLPRIRFEVADVSTLPARHADPALEERVTRAVGVPLDLTSTTAHEWGLASINRVLRDLGVSNREAIVLSGFGDSGSPVVSVIVVPGVSGPRLTEAFGPGEELAPGYRFRTEIVGGEAVRLSSGTLPSGSLPSGSLPSRNEVWLGGWFAVDGYLARFGGRELPTEAVKATLMRLRDALRGRA